MNEQGNTSVSPEPSGVLGWVFTWISVVTKPSEQTNAAMSEHPDSHSNNRAFTWVFLAGTRGDHHRHSEFDP